MRALLSLACVCCGIGVALGQAFPALNGENLRAEAVRLPDMLAKQPAIVIMTFSRGAQQQAREWFEALPSAAPGVRIVRVAVVEDVPRFVRGMMKSGMRKGIPPAQQGDFVLLFEGEKPLRQLAGVQSDGDAYVLVLDGAGMVKGRSSGKPTPDKLQALSSEWLALTNPERKH